MVTVTITIHELGPNEIIIEPKGVSKNGTQMEREVSNRFRIAIYKVMDDWQKEWIEKHGATTRVEGFSKINPKFKQDYQDEQ